MTSHCPAGLRPWIASSGEPLEAALAPPTVICVEQEAGAPAPEAAAGIAPGAPWLSLSLITATAYHVPVAHAFVTALDTRLHLHLPERPRIETALHEAVVNAILHGNLGLPSPTGNGFAAIDGLERQLQDRLRNDDIRQRRVFVGAHWSAVCVSVCVGDEGMGYDAGAVAADPLTATSFPNGRGRSLIGCLSDGVEVVEDGRCTWLEFRR